jgi:DNA-binding winged helix-turn-helix (wHTH) protein/Tol biopolymer transport system component
MSFVAPPSPNLRFGQFELDAAAGQLRKAGLLIKLQPQPFHVLLLLAERAGTVVTREDIQQSLWSDSTFVDFDHGINFSINQIRGALADNADNPRYIETLPRRGYRFIAPVTSNGSDQRGTVSESPFLLDRADNSPGSAPGPITELSPEIPVIRRTWGRTATVVLALIVIAGFAGYGLYRWTSRTPSSNFERLRFTKITGSGKAEDAAISPDGNYIVYSQRDRKGSGLWLRQLSSGSDVQILPSQEPGFRGLTFSPDGNSIYFVRERKDIYSFKDLYSMPILGGPYRLLTKNIDSPVSFSPDGHQFVYTRGVGLPDGNEIRVANADGSNDRLLAAVYDTSFSFQAGAEWSPNGGTIAVSLMLRGKRSGYVLDSVSVVDGSVREVFWNAGVIGRPLWFPEGNKVLVVVDDATGRGQLWTITLPQGERRRVTNDLANWGIRIASARDATKVAAVQWSLSANLWDVTAANPSQPRQITFGETPEVGAVPGTAGKILAVSGDGQPWIMSEDGTERRPFSNLRDVALPVMCGQFVVLTSYAAGGGEDSRVDAGSINATKLAGGRFVVQRSYQSGPANLVRIDADGLNATTLATGLVYSPSCSPDGQVVFYVLMGSPQKIMRIPIDGGEPTAIGEIPGLIRGSMQASPDGQFLAFPYDVYLPNPPAAKLAVISINQKRIYKIFDSPPGVFREASLRWSPDGKALQYLLTKADVTNIWEQPLGAGGPKQVTKFTSGRIFDFNWSHDGKHLLLSRGEIISDVVLLSNLR